MSTLVPDHNMVLLVVIQVIRLDIVSVVVGLEPSSTSSTKSHSSSSSFSSSSRSERISEITPGRVIIVACIGCGAKKVVGRLAGNVDAVARENARRAVSTESRGTEAGQQTTMCSSGQRRDTATDSDRLRSGARRLSALDQLARLTEGLLEPDPVRVDAGRHQQHRSTRIEEALNWLPLGVAILTVWRFCMPRGYRLPVGPDDDERSTSFLSRATVCQTSITLAS